MSPIRGSSERISELRGTRGETQVEFAKVLEVTQPMISAWEGGSESPSPGAYMRLGNMASYPDNLWFWEQAGLDCKGMLSAAEKLLKDRGLAPAAGEVARVLCTRKTNQGEKPLDRFLLLPAESVPNPGSTRCLLIDETAASPWVPAGSFVVLDASQQDLASSWGQVVFVDDRELNKVLMGRLVFKHEKPKHWNPEFPPFPCWIATVGSFGDFETERQQGDTESVRVGEWNPLDVASQRTTDFQRYHNLCLEFQTHRQERTKEDADKLFKKLNEQAPSQVQCDPAYRILGQVIAWFRSK